MKSKLVQTAPGGERTFVLVFDPGDEVLAGLEAFATGQDVGAGTFTAIGALSSVKFGFFDLERKEYESIEVTEQVEVLSLIGNVARKEDGSVQVHPHIVVGKRDGTALGGHFMRGYVQPTLEVMLVEDPATLRRTFRPEFGIALIDLEEG